MDEQNVYGSSPSQTLREMHVMKLADQTPFMVGPLMNASIRSKKNVDMSPKERLKAINSIKYIK